MYEAPGPRWGNGAAATPDPSHPSHPSHLHPLPFSRLSARSPTPLQPRRSRAERLELWPDPVGAPECDFDAESRIVNPSLLRSGPWSGGGGGVPNSDPGPRACGGTGPTPGPATGSGPSAGTNRIRKKFNFDPNPISVPAPTQSEIWSRNPTQAGSGFRPLKWGTLFLGRTFCGPGPDFGPKCAAGPRLLAMPEISGLGPELDSGPKGGCRSGSGFGP